MQSQNLVLKSFYRKGEEKKGRGGRGRRGERRGSGGGAKFQVITVLKSGTGANKHIINTHRLRSVLFRLRVMLLVRTSGHM